MKKSVIFGFFVLGFIFTISSCEKKNAAEKFLDDASEKTEKAAEKVGEAAEEGADKTEKEGTKAGKKLKKLLNN